jgi:hypothetical protein
MLEHLYLLYKYIHLMNMISHEDDLKHIQEHRDHVAMEIHVESLTTINK